MTEASIDRLPVAQLPERYGISRTVLYDRINALKITPEKRGNKSFVNAEQIALLDDLHEHLKRAGSTADFLDRVGLSTQQQAEQSTKQPTGQLAPTNQVAELVKLVDAIAFQLTPAHSRYRESFRFLEEAYQNEWLLSTSHLADLLELSPAGVNKKPCFERYGFIFSKVGKNGTETAWRVDKVSPGESYSYAHLPEKL
jgi:hypothetical protein